MKVRRYLSDCKNGEVLAEDIYVIGNNIPLAVKGNIVDDRLREKLEDNRIYKILTDQKEQEAQGEVKKNPGKIKTEKFIYQYSKNLFKLKSVFQNIASGRKIELKEITEMATGLLDNSEDIFRVIDSMHSIRGLDEYTYTHSINVALYSMITARWMGMEEDMIHDVIKAGLLHDIGKAKIPSHILNKSGPLTDSEFENVKEHPILGYEICEEMGSLKSSIKEAVLLHHEKIDGSGYPGGLRGEDINLYSKIVGIADIYDAITSDRVYRKKRTPFETFQEIRDMGYGKLDTEIIDVFLSNIASFYVGSKVRMNTGEFGKVAFVYPHKIDRPIVKMTNGNFVDISREKNYRIEELI